MILSVSRRTDIPAYYADWLMQRLAQGTVLVRNPMNRAQISRIALSPETIDCVMFWTKDPEPMLRHLDTLDALGYAYAFQFTVTPYGRDLEPRLRDKAAIEETFCTLSRRLGRHRVLWRYDPIVVDDRYTVEFHRQQFSRLCERFAPYTESVTVSFVDLYPKLKGRPLRAPDDAEIEQLAWYIGRTAAACGLTARACCEQMDLRGFGIQPGACLDPAVLSRVCGAPLALRPDKNQRPGCGCCESVDIGAYNTCPAGCIYCYANYSASSVEKNRLQHDPTGELLSGVVLPGEKWTERKIKSNRQA